MRIDYILWRVGVVSALFLAAVGTLLADAAVRLNNRDAGYAIVDADRLASGPGVYVQVLAGPTGSWAL